MALIPCPECGKEISDQAPACIHCGYPLPPKGPELLSPDEPNRFSVVLTAKCNYPENRRRTIRVLIDQLGISKTEAEAYMDNTELGPVLLRSGMTEESARDFAGILARAGAHVQVVDGSQPCDLAPHTAPPPQGLTFGEVVWAVGIPAALCGLAGGYVGSGLALRGGAKVIRPMFFVVLALLTVRLIFDLAA